MLKIAVLGATGRTGKYLIPEIIKNKNTDLGAVFVSPKNELANKTLDCLYNRELLKNLSSLIVSTDIEKNIASFDVLIDFTNPETTMKAINICNKHNKKIVVATTGLNQQQEQLIKKISETTAIVYAANMSIGMNNMFNLVQKVSENLKEEADIDIVDIHHRFKKDAPSGTAIKLGEAVSGKSTLELMPAYFVDVPHTDNKLRPNNSIGFSIRRSGNIAGEHSVIFTTEEETLEIHHKVNNRSVFAKGAVTAACFIEQHKSGLFDMQDVLGLTCSSP